MSTGVAISTALASRFGACAAAGVTCGGGASSDASVRPNVIRSPAPSASVATAPAAIAFPPRFFGALADATGFEVRPSVVRTTDASELVNGATGVSELVNGAAVVGDVGDVSDVSELAADGVTPGSVTLASSSDRSDFVISARSGFLSERASNEGGSIAT